MEPDPQINQNNDSLSEPDDDNNIVYDEDNYEEQPQPLDWLFNQSGSETDSSDSEASIAGVIFRDENDAVYWVPNSWPNSDNENETDYDIDLSLSESELEKTDDEVENLVEPDVRREYEINEENDRET